MPRRSASGRYRPVAATAGFSSWQPAMLNRTTGFCQQRTFKPRSDQPVEFSVPFSFLLVLIFLLCAVISPVVGAGIVWALCVERWRYSGGRAGKTGAILAAVFIATYFALNALLGEGTPVQPMSVAAAGGAGLTAGALGACAWIWMRVRTGLAVPL